MHEAGHQFWYGIVATNEFEHAWMDEGLNTYSTARVDRAALQPQLLREAVLRRVRAVDVPRFSPRPRDRRRSPGIVPTGRSERHAVDTDRGGTGPAPAGAITYDKTALWLHTLERVLGWETVQRIAVHVLRPMGIPPSEAAGFLRRRERGQRPRHDVVLRPGVSQLERVRLRRRHVHERAGRRTRICRRRQSRTFSEGSAGAGPYPHHGGRAPARRGTFPVDVRVVFENNEEARWRWDGQDRWKLFEIDKPVRARRSSRSIRIMC